MFGSVPAIADYPGLGGRDAQAELWRLEQEHRRLEYRLTALIDAVDRSGVFADDGHRSVKQWAIGIAHWTPAEAALRLRCARMLRDLPAVAAMLGAGELPIAHLRAIAAAWANPRVRALLPDHIDLLLGYARTMRFEDFQVVLRRWEANADRDGARQRHQDADQQRNASIDQVGDEYLVNANVGTAQGAILAKILEAYTAAEFTADCDHAGPGQPLARTPAQRRADALFNIFQAAAGDGRGIDVTINLNVDLATFDDELRRTAGASPRPSDPSSWATRRCETTDGVPVDPADMLAMAASGWIRRRVLDAHGVTTDLGRRRRCFTGPAREALHLGEFRCAWNGCTVPAAFTHADHTDDFRHGSATAPVNGGLLCPHHNRYKNHGYRLTRHPDGTWTTHRPDGTQLGRPPDSPPGFTRPRVAIELDHRAARRQRHVAAHLPIARSPITALRPARPQDRPAGTTDDPEQRPVSCSAAVPIGSG